MKYFLTLCVGSLLFPTGALNAQERLDTTKVYQMQELTVTAGLVEQNVKTTQMGKVTLGNDLLKRMPVMFGEPDIVKVLQTQPGVSQGIEGFTGLYVHGGENDQNLFIYQGLPLYHVSHLGGIFSSFNVATVGKADFYKASFPAQYGGRISSITDVTMKPADFKKFTGEFTLGLLSGNAYISGPLIRNKSAFSAAIRRSWLDAVTVPALALINASKKSRGEKSIGHYAFTDLNARIDHRFSNKVSAFVMGYYGHDRLRIGERTFDGEQDPNLDMEQTHFYDENVNKLAWGNWGVLGNVQIQTAVGNINVNGYYSNYSSIYEQREDYQRDMSDENTLGYIHTNTQNSIRDIGANVSYKMNLGNFYSLQLGGDLVRHDYMPENLFTEVLKEGKQLTDGNEGGHIMATEAFVYADNTVNLTEWIALNAGMRAGIYSIQGEKHKVIEPRAAIRLKVTDDYSIKAGYARMNQFVQQLSSNYINLPTDMWQPITAQGKPLTSNQFSAGIYGNLPSHYSFSVEGWYKDMHHIQEYKDGITLLNPNLPWYEKITTGKGWSYGVDLTLTKTAGRITGTMGYGLMWNWRKFDDLNGGEKFAAKFDNRHKLNINANYKLNDKIEFNAGWTYMTGNRMTLSLYNYDNSFNHYPDAPQVIPPSWDEQTGLDYFTKRNNVRLPAYHRLDLGMTVRRVFRNGASGTWNFGLYNAYSYMNPLTIKKEEYGYGESQNEQGHRHFKTYSLIPVLPSISYTYSF